MMYSVDYEQNFDTKIWDRQNEMQLIMWLAIGLYFYDKI